MLRKIISLEFGQMDRGEAVAVLIILAIGVTVYLMATKL